MPHGSQPRHLFGYASLAILLLADVAQAADWPQFLGPARNGISAESDLIQQWPADGPKVLWRVEGGAGMSGVAILNGRAVTMIQRDSDQIVLVLDATTGKTLQAVPVAPEFDNPMGAGPRATPALAGDRAYVYTGEGILAAVDVKDGKVVWSHDVVSELGGKPAEYGMACSPLLLGDQIIVTAGASRGTVAAFEAATGKPAWQAVAGNGRDTAGYSSPALLQVADEQQLVAFEGKAAIGLAPATGKLLWRYPYVTDYDCNIATPISVDGKVFISSGENHGSTLLDIVKTGDSYKATVAWESQGPKSVLRTEWQTALLHDGHLYGFDNVGSAGPVTHLTCVEAATGKRKWQELRFGKGNLILADGKLFATTMQGELVVIKASPEKYEELGRQTLLRSTRQAPALANGMLYLRDDREIVCVNVKAGN